MTPAIFFSTILVICMSILTYILNFHTPSSLGAFGVLAVFVLLYVIFTLISFLSIHRLRVSLAKTNNINTEKSDVSYRVSYYYGSVVALAPLLILSLRSVGKLNSISLILVAALLGVVSLYISRQIK